MAKCPACSKPILTFKHGVIKSSNGTRQISCVAFACPSCDAVISVQTDPTVAAKYTAELVKKKLGR